MLIQFKAKSNVRDREELHTLSDNTINYNKHKVLFLTESVVKKASLSLQATKREPSLWKILSIKSTYLSLIRLWDNVVYTVNISYVADWTQEKLAISNYLVPHMNFLLTKKDFNRTFHKLFHSI